MTTEPDPLSALRSGRLGRVPAFASPTDPARLLAAVADALNSLERAGITADVDHDAVSTPFGYVIPVGDPRLGNRWAYRARIPAEDHEDQQPQAGCTPPEENPG